MRISDWSSDVCSSDLSLAAWRRPPLHRAGEGRRLPYSIPAAAGWRRRFPPERKRKARGCAVVSGHGRSADSALCGEGSRRDWRGCGAARCPPRARKLPARDPALLQAPPFGEENERAKEPATEKI